MNVSSIELWLHVLCFLGIISFTAIRAVAIANEDNKAYIVGTAAGQELLFPGFSSVQHILQ